MLYMLAKHTMYYIRKLLFHVSLLVLCASCKIALGYPGRVKGEEFQ